MTSLHAQNRSNAATHCNTLQHTVTQNSHVTYVNEACHI